MTSDSSEAYVTREKSKELSTFDADTIQIGVSRPTLPLADLSHWQIAKTRPCRMVGLPRADYQRSFFRFFLCQLYIHAIYRATFS